MTYTELYKSMCDNRLVSGKWRNLLPMLENRLTGLSAGDREIVMKLFVLYFSRVDDGNTYMPLDEGKVTEWFTDKINRQIVEMQEENDKADVQPLKDLAAEITSITGSIDLITTNLPIVGDRGADALFILDDNRLFAGKYFYAVKSIIESAARLFKAPTTSAATIPSGMIKDDFKLNAEQQEILTRGMDANLLVTGGPGTGKTASVLFLLLMLLEKHSEYTVYMTAPSGKAAANLSSSVSEGLTHVTDAYKTDPQKEIKKIKDATGQTIHRLLDTDRDTGKFVHNAKNPFPADSVFVIDEASMIDVCVFASLLEAIPTGARVFILGDRDQLPSVECGAVFAELLDKYPDNVVTLTESKRFTKGSVVDELAKKINAGADLGLQQVPFVRKSAFSTMIDGTSAAAIAASTIPNPVFYFADDEPGVSDKDRINTITEAWYKKFFNGSKDFIKQCAGLTDTDKAVCADIAETAEKAKILCALNGTTRGSENINKVILDKFYRGKKQKKYGEFYVGEVLMIQRNLRDLGLYNGDCGVAVKFENDRTLYFMIRENPELKPIEGKPKDQHNVIFKLGNYYFYPISQIGTEDVTPAFAISIHKSQGSGYENVLVILPRTKEHPLLNRQIIYTAITRTKGKTYILSNADNLQSAANHNLIRDTGIA